MDFEETLSTCLEALTLNKTRTALAALGIIIGVGAVIALMSLGQGGQKAVSSQIESLGSNLLSVSPGAQMMGGVRGQMGSRESLTYEDAKAIAESTQITTVAAVSAELSQRGQVVAGRNNTNTSIVGVLPAYTEIRKIEMESGAFISEHDVESRTKVAVLGPRVVEDLFGEDTNPVGESVRLEGLNFRVIGVTESRGGTGFFSQDDIVYIPLTTAQKQVFGQDYVSSISVSAKNDKVMEQAKSEIGSLLLVRHKISDPAQADFSIMSQEDIIGTMTQVTSTFTALLSGIAAISLLVGGIGIMNIMLVTVIERTREVGLRKALGAKKRDIITQFLTESVILTGAGGLLGIILGTLISLVLVRMVNIPWAFSPHSYLLSFGVSAIIGIVFGFYPAYKAARLSPIEALRYE
jgi:putative ABC transport system permease protein